MDAIQAALPVSAGETKLSPRFYAHRISIPLQYARLASERRQIIGYKEKASPTPAYSAIH